MYPTRIEAGSESYNKISLFLSEIAFKSKYTKESLFYFLDSRDRGIAKLNSEKKTIELTDKVEEWIINSIDKINKKGDMK